MGRDSWGMIRMSSFNGAKESTNDGIIGISSTYGSQWEYYGMFFFLTNINQQFDEWDIAVIMGMLLMMMIMLIMMVIIKVPPFTTIGQ